MHRRTDGRTDMSDSYLPIMNILGPHRHIQVVFGRLTLQVFQVPAFLISLMIFFRFQNIYFYILPICKSVFFLFVLLHRSFWITKKFFLKVYRKILCWSKIFIHTLTRIINTNMHSQCKKVIWFNIMYIKWKCI